MKRVKKIFKPRIFIYPVGEFTNESIAKDPNLLQVQPDLHVECYFGSNKVRRNVWPVDKDFYKDFLLKSKLSFYAFTQNEEDGNRQYFHSQNLKKVIDSDILEDEMAILLKQLRESQKRSTVKI